MNLLGVNRLVGSSNSSSTNYNKVVVGAKEIVKRTRSSVHTEEVIDLTSDDPADEFAMVVDLPSDKEDSNMVVVKNEPGNEDGYKGWDENDVAIYEEMMKMRPYNLCGCISRYLHYLSTSTSDMPRTQQRSM